MLFIIDAYYSEWIKYISMIAFVIASFWVIGERTWATIYLKGYENKRSVKTIIGVIILQWFLAATIVYSFFMSYVPVVIPIIGIAVSCAAFLIVYRFMQKENRRRYRYSKKFGNAYTLSERYQLAENIQTEPIVSTLLIISVIFESLHLISGAILHFGTNINTKLIGKLLFEILFTIDPIVFSIPLLLSVKKWRQIFRQYLLRKHICSCNISEYDNNSVQEINDVKKEGDVYFKQLRQSWT
uniref:Uncharacterized protein n=1 Tax=Panagrolaimus sp. PS1159 TaxID=55785 RepID=A0AC35GSE9_9BILA